MPYKSIAQQGYFHSHEKELLSQGVNVKEWDKAYKGKKLPEKVKKAADGNLTPAQIDMEKKIPEYMSRMMRYSQGGNDLYREQNKLKREQGDKPMKVANPPKMTKVASLLMAVLVQNQQKHAQEYAPFAQPGAAGIVNTTAPAGTQGLQPAKPPDIASQRPDAAVPPMKTPQPPNPTASKPPTTPGLPTPV